MELVNKTLSYNSLLDHFKDMHAYSKLIEMDWSLSNLLLNFFIQFLLNLEYLTVVSNKGSCFVSKDFQ